MNINSLVFILCFSAPLVSALQLAAACSETSQLFLEKKNNGRKKSQNMNSEFDAFIWKCVDMKD